MSLALNIALATKIVEFPNRKQYWRELYIFLDIFLRAAPEAGWPLEDELLLTVLRHFKRTNHFATDHLYYAMQVCPTLCQLLEPAEQIELARLLEAKLSASLLKIGVDKPAEI